MLSSHYVTLSMSCFRSASDASDAAATATAVATTTGPLNCVRDAHAAGISYETATAVKLSSNSQSVDLRHGSHEAVTQINGKTDKCELARRKCVHGGGPLGESFERD